MQKIKTLSSRCLLIKPDNTIAPVILAFDEIFATTTNASNYQIIRDNIFHKYNFSHNRMNFLTAPFPDHTHYSIFYNCVTSSSNQTNNSIGKQITGNFCYGECIILHFDSFNELHDIDRDTFIKIYNSKYPKNPIITCDNLAFTARKKFMPPNKISLDLFSG